MAKGYLGLPEDTKEKFLPNVFVDEAHRSPTDRLYKTGDVGRYLPSGIVECCGRRDDQVEWGKRERKKKKNLFGNFLFQVKIRGFRVELREIDTFLIQVEQ